jgi:arylformamidase
MGRRSVDDIDWRRVAKTIADHGAATTTSCLRVPTRIYDISRQVDTSIPVWPGDAPFRVDWIALRSAGAIANVSALLVSPHTGTHADAPLHVRDSAEGIGEMDLAPFIGLALVVDVSKAAAIDREVVQSALRGHSRPERILFRTAAWGEGSAFPRTFAALTPEAIEILRSAGVRLVGTDAPSVDPFDSPDLPAHHALVSAGIAILENLYLDEVPPGAYELIALPLKLSGVDASPVRAILRTVEEGAEG